MIQRSSVFFILWVITLLFTGCDEEKKRRLPRHSGASGEVMLVISDELWHGPEGDTLRSVLEDFVPLLPQAEPRFSLLRFRLDQMSDLLKQHRNIIEIEVGNGVEPEKEGVKVLRDKWSSHQLVFTMRARNRSDFFDLVTEQLPRIADIIDQTEIDRLKKKYARFNEPEINELVREKFGLDMRFPTETELAKEKNNFVWLKRERVKYKGNVAHDITQGFFVFRYPYKGEESLTERSVLAARDSVLKAHVPGPGPGSYMTTEYRFPPYSRAVNKNDRYTLLTDGLWRTENAFMGGPFTALTTVSDDGNYVVSISGFVFAPNFQKREFIREIRAVLDGMRFYEEKDDITDK